MERKLRRTLDTFRGTEDPAGVSGHLRGLGRIMEQVGSLCPGSEISGLGSVRGGRTTVPPSNLEVVVCRDPGELDLTGWKPQ